MSTMFRAVGAWGVRAGALGLAWALSGCFTSDLPLLNAADADYPFAARVDYMHVDVAGVQTQGRLERQGDVYVRSETGRTPDTHVLFQSLRDDYYLVQESSAESAAPNYDLVRITPEAVYLYNFRCDTLLDAVAIQEGRMTSSTDSLGGLVCTLQDLETLREALGERIAFAGYKEEFRILGVGP